MSTRKEAKVVFISSICSDIGTALANRYVADGHQVVGTYFSDKSLGRLKGVSKEQLFFCDLNDKESIRNSVAALSQLDLSWDVFISCAAWPPPLINFFDSSFDQWSKSVHVNAVEQLRFLHAIHSLRKKGRMSTVVFFAGPGSNNAPKAFSAVSLSKIALMKMCELIDAENEDMNPFIIGPGWTRTKTHEEILADPSVSREKYEETKHFLESDDPGTSMDDIYRCIQWLTKQGKTVAGGRNFSVVHDRWGKQELADILIADFNMYKLRRYRNEWGERGTTKSLS